MCMRGNKVRTPGGACLGERVMIDGKLGIRYKAGRLEEDLLPEQLAECISGVPVERIVYKSTRMAPAAT